MHFAFVLIVFGMQFDIGLTESILAAAASRIGKTVLHLDSNDYYGGLWASFNLESIESIANQNSCIRLNPNVRLNDGGIITLHPEAGGVIENAEIEWRIPANVLEIGNKTDDEKIDEQTEERSDEIELPENTWTKDKVMHDFRKFNIDLTPKVCGALSFVSLCFCDFQMERTLFFISPFKLLFARGDLVELLISSNISRYAEFRAVDRIVTCVENEMKVVPCSRADVFTNKNVTVLEKRLLMKALSSCLSEDNEEEFKGSYQNHFKMACRVLLPNFA